MIQFNKTNFLFIKRLALVTILLTIANYTWALGSMETIYTEPSADITVKTIAAGKVYANQIDESPEWSTVEDKDTDNSTFTFQTKIQSSQLQGDGIIGILISIFGANAVNSEQTIYLYAQDISEDGYSFDGWYVLNEDNEEELMIENEDGTTSHAKSFTVTRPITLINSNTDNCTFIAKWSKPEVINAGTLDSFGTITDPNATIASKNATFTVANFNSAADFVGSTSTNPVNGTQPATAKGFQKVAGEAITDNTYTLPVTFIPTGIHGEVTGRAILKVKAYNGETTGEPTNNDWKYVTLTAREDYTPDFTAQSSYNFGTVSLGSSRPSDSNLYPTTNNYAAGAEEGTIMGTKWEHTIVADENADADYSQYFTVTQSTKEPKVTFNPGSNNVFGLGNTDGTNTKDISALLQMKCTYYDAAGKALSTDYQYTTLNATVKRDLTSRLSFLNNQETCDLREIKMGDNTQKVELVLDYANVDFADNACQLDEDNVLFDLQSTKPNGSIVTVTIPDTESFDGCKEYTATLTVTGTSTLQAENSKSLTCQITLKATLEWGDAPVVTGAGTNKKVTFTWNEVPGARSYQVYATTPGGNTLEPKGDPIPAGGTMKYEVTTDENGSDYAVKCYVVAINSTDCSITSNESVATPALNWIDKNNMASTGLKTGIADGYTASGLPEENQTNRDIVLTAAFDASGNPIMDTLYIFGETTCASSNKIISKDNAITPVLVYQKEVSEKGKGYRLVDKGGGTTIPNVCTTRSSYLTIDASGLSAIYFTGYCPFASTGNIENEGVIYIAGGEQALDIYLNDLQIYATNNSGSKTIDLNEINGSIQNAGMKYYSKGSGSVFAIESASTNVNAPFNVQIHICKQNILSAALGSTVTINAKQSNQILIDDKPKHYSSPIKVLRKKENTITNISIDDLLNATRTYASLSLTTNDIQSNPAPSIDLGNQYTKLTIDGGLIKTQEIVAAYQTATYAVSSNSSFEAYGLQVGEENNNKINNNRIGSLISIKNGTFNSTSATKWYATNMYIDGGAYENEPEHYAVDNASTKTTIKNSDSKELGYAMISNIEKYGNSNEYNRFIVSDFDQMVDDLFPDYGVNDQTTTGYHNTLSVYYTNATTKYGVTNLYPHNNSLALMLPTLSCATVKIAWQVCAPNFAVATADGKTKLGGGIPYAAGCGVHKTPYQVDRLLHMKMDQYTYGALGSGYFPSIYAGGATISLENEENDETPLYETIDNESDYKIGQKVYMLMPIVADQWNLFAAPFDVANVYVIESYPEAQILKDFKTYHGMVHPDEVANARKAQAERTLELYALWYSTIKNFGGNVDFFGSYNDANGDGTLDNNEKYGAFVNTWITYEQNNNKNKEGGNYTPEICQLIHFNGNNTNQAHYFLYEQDGDWEYTAATNEDEEAKFKTSWIPVAATPSATPNSTQAIMTKGNVYAMQFPYNIIGGTHDPAKQWDYWTGKYLLIESTLKTGGDEVDANGKPINKHIISGSNFKTSGLFNDNVGSGKAKLCGNATFAELSGISTPTGTSLWTLTKDHNQEIEVEVKLENGTKTTATVKRDVHKFTPMDDEDILAPGQGIVVANFTAPIGMRAISINYRTGEVEYVKIDGENPDDDNPGLGSGLPTIMGDITLIVEPTSEGLTITPIKEQHVMLFDANGKMIFSKHLSAEENVTLPTGVYVVRGEYEQVKAIKK